MPNNDDDDDIHVRHATSLLTFQAHNHLTSSVISLLFNGIDLRWKLQTFADDVAPGSVD